MSVLLVRAAGSPVVKSVGPITERSLIPIPELTWYNCGPVALSKALNSNCSWKLLWIRLYAKWRESKTSRLSKKSTWVSPLCLNTLWCIVNVPVGNGCLRSPCSCSDVHTVNRWGEINYVQYFAYCFDSSALVFSVSYVQNSSKAINQNIG